MAILLDGKSLSAQIQSEIRNTVDLKFVDQPRPKLGVILVGENPASMSYVKTKSRMAEKLGFIAEVVRFPVTVTREEILEQIRIFNEDPVCDGAFIQFPLPKHLDPIELMSHVNPDKDSDGSTAINFGRMLMGAKGAFLPCTPRGIIRLLKHYGVTFEGKHAVVIGRSNIVGKPMATLLLQEDCTVTICHRKTQNFETYVRMADILVVATGVPNLVKGSWIKEGAIVVDAGFTKDEEGKIWGDVEFEAASKRAAMITPVPGGVGPMTVITLMEQTLESALKRIQ